MNKDLLKKLEQLHEDDKFSEIIELIIAIPKSDRNYDLIMHLARAYNNNDNFDEAIEQLFLVEVQGENDPFWHFRLGYAYFYKDEFAKAIESFKTTYKLDENFPSIDMFLSMAQNALYNFNNENEDSIVATNTVIDNNEFPKSPYDNQNFHRSRDICPFRIISYETGNSLLLDVGSYKNELFEIRQDEGFEGNGYDWASLAEVFLHEKKPELKDIIGFDPEGSMFCAYSDDLDALYEFALSFHSACEDDDLIVDLFSRAELD
ncbi:MAG: immunity 51 family protein [Methanobacteriaceae archaeon]|jgi:tetratricopeptide (TPR) repeat protein|nr:immunity 51 family protein [Candidatus Methanorudis spinitermitis]